MASPPSYLSAQIKLFNFPPIRPTNFLLFRNKSLIHTTLFSGEYLYYIE